MVCPERLHCRAAVGRPAESKAARVVRALSHATFTDTCRGHARRVDLIGLPSAFEGLVDAIDLLGQLRLAFARDLTGATALAEALIAELLCDCFGWDDNLRLVDVVEQVIIIALRHHCLVPSDRRGADQLPLVGRKR